MTMAPSMTRSMSSSSTPAAAAATLLLLLAAAAPHAAAAGTPGAAAFGAAAAKSALDAAAEPAVLASNGATAASGTSSTSSSLSDRFAFASRLRTQLEGIFKDRPEALSRIREAWDIESRSGFRAAAGDAGSLSFPGTVLGYRLPRNISGDASSVQAMDHAPLDPATAEAMNALYEADHPKFQSRMPELVQGRGYPLERYTVVTPDGYELVMFRIPHGKNRNTQPGPRPVVLLHHGVTLASDCFVVLNENESLGFLLADAGFDVWFANTRGNTYSRRNTRGLYPFQLPFWYFSIDELALQDLPTQLDFALAKSGASKLAFIGHSQGCTLAYLLCADKPEYNSKFSVIAHMGPVVFVDFFRAPALRFIATASLDQLLYLLGIGEFIPNRLTAPIAGVLCSKWPLSDVCAAAVSLFTFGPSIFITPDDYLFIARTWPSSVGSRNLVHWAQNFRSPELEFRKYDFGNACNLTKWKPGHGFVPKPYFETCNQAVYGTTEPPVYDLTKVTAPTVFFVGENDVVTVASDVQEEQRRIGAATRAQFLYTDYSHMDMIWDRNAKHAVDLVDVMLRFAPGTF